jgi:hypothetical protein
LNVIGRLSPLPTLRSSIGLLVWNRRKKVIRRGTKKQQRRERDEWMRIEAPEWRIVSDELWDAVHARLVKAGDCFARRQEASSTRAPPGTTPSRSTC